MKIIVSQFKNIKNENLWKKILLQRWKVTSNPNVQKIKLLQTCFINALNIARWKENNNYDLLDNSWFSDENLFEFREKIKTKNTNPFTSW